VLCCAGAGFARGSAVLANVAESADEIEGLRGEFTLGSTSCKGSEAVPS
jgi:hypothetical protein